MKKINVVDDLSQKLLTKNIYGIQSSYIEITSECPLRCKHCYNSSGPLKNYLSPEIFKRVLDCYNLESGDITTITISGGEPLAHPNFWEIFSLAIESAIDDVIVITNAVLIDHEQAQKFAAYADTNTYLQISLNGSESTYHDYLCGAGSFERTVAGLDQLLAAGFRKIMVRITITDHNKDNILDTISYLAQKGVTMISLGTLKTSGRGLDNQEKLLIPIDELSEYLDSLSQNESIKSFENKGIKIQIPGALTSGCPLAYPSKTELTFNPRIDSEGYVFLCQNFSDPLYSIGNIHTSHLQDICYSSECASMLNFINSGIKYMKSCSRCIWNGVCSRGCIADIINNGSIQETDGYCHFRQMQFERELFK